MDGASVQNKGSTFFIYFNYSNHKSVFTLFAASVFRLKAARRLFPSLRVSRGRLAQLCGAEELQPLPRVFGDAA